MCDSSSKVDVARYFRGREQNSYLSSKPDVEGWQFSSIELTPLFPFPAPSELTMPSAEAVLAEVSTLAEAMENVRRAAEEELSKGEYVHRRSLCLLPIMFRLSVG